MEMLVDSRSRYIIVSPFLSRAFIDSRRESSDFVISRRYVQQEADNSGAP